ncbi:MAG: hypothetical protein AcusKO_17830 [Acuticoccus sp.]
MRDAMDVNKLLESVLGSQRAGTGEGGASVPGLGGGLPSGLLGGNSELFHGR